MNDIKKRLYHLSAFLQELAPFPSWVGCRGVIGPVPLPLLMMYVSTHY